MDAATGQDIAGRMTQLHADALTVGTQAQAMMKNAQFETRLPFQVVISDTGLVCYTNDSANNGKTHFVQFPSESLLTKSYS